MPQISQNQNNLEEISVSFIIFVTYLSDELKPPWLTQTVRTAFHLLLGGFKQHSYDCVRTGSYNHYPSMKQMDFSCLRISQFCLRMFRKGENIHSE